MDFADLTRINGAFIESRILQTAVLLGIFDAVNDSATAETVAARLRTNPRATGMLMNALVAMGLLLKQQGVFRLTAAADTYLRSDAPYSLTGMILFDAALWDSWARLPQAVRTGQPARRPHKGGNVRGDFLDHLRAADAAGGKHPAMRRQPPRPRAFREHHTRFIPAAQFALRAEGNRADLLRRADDAFGENEPHHQLNLVARSPHECRDRLVADEDSQRLFGDELALLGRPPARPDDEALRQGIGFLVHWYCSGDGVIGRLGN